MTNPPLLVYGLLHLDRPEENILEPLFEDLKRNGVTRLGAEHVHDEKSFKTNDSIDQFWKKFSEHAAENGIELVHLENDLRSSALVVVHQLLLSADSRKQSGAVLAKTAQLLRVDMRKNALNYDRIGITKNGLNKALEVIDEIAKYAKTPEAVSEIFDCLTLPRSNTLHQNGRKEKVQAIAVGSVHAYHIEKNFGTPTKYFPRLERLKEIGGKEIENRLDMKRVSALTQKHHQLIRKVNVILDRR